MADTTPVSSEDAPAPAAAPVRPAKDATVPEAEESPTDVCSVNLLVGQWQRVARAEPGSGGEGQPSPAPAPPQPLRGGDASREETKSSGASRGPRVTTQQRLMTWSDSAAPPAGGGARPPHNQQQPWRGRGGTGGADSADWRSARGEIPPDSGSCAALLFPSMQTLTGTGTMAPAPYHRGIGAPSASSDARHRDTDQAPRQGDGLMQTPSLLASEFQQVHRRCPALPCVPRHPACGYRHDSEPTPTRPWAPGTRPFG